MILWYPLVGCKSYCFQYPEYYINQLTNLYHLLKVSGLQWYVDDSPHLWAVLGSALTGKMGENGQSLDRAAKPCTDQTVGC